MKICRGANSGKLSRKWQISSIQNWLILSCSLIIAGLCRLPGLQEIFWRDEVFTAWAASYSPWDIPGVLAIHDVSPPLYYILLSIWARLFGDNDLALRGLSLFIGFLCLGILYFVALRWWDKNTAICVALLAATAPGLAYISQEVRNQVIVSLLLLIATVSMWQWLQNPSRRQNLLVYIFTAAGAAYCHYLAFVAIGLLFIYGLAKTIARGSKKNFYWWIFTQVVIFLCLLPWLPGMKQQLQGARLSQNIGQKNSMSSVCNDILANIAAEDPLRSFRVVFRSQMSGRFADAFTVGMLLLVIVLIGRKGLRWDHPVWLMLFMAVGMAVCMALLHGLTGAKSNPRYFTVFSVFMLPAFAFLLAVQRPVCRWPVLVLICGLQTFICIHDARVAPVPWSGVAQYLENHGGGLALSQYWLGGEALRRYGYVHKTIDLPFDLPSVETSRRRKVGYQLTLQRDFSDLNNLLAREKSAWLITTNDPGDIAVGSDYSLHALKQFAVTHGWRLEYQKKYNGADIWRFSR